MNSLKLFCFAFSLSTLLAVPNSFAQEEKNDTSDFDGNMKSLMNDVFHRFDEKYGTNIFSGDEPMNTNDNDSCDCDEDMSPRRHYRDYRPFREQHSTYFADNKETFIHRNSTMLYPWYPVDDHVLFRYNRVEGLFLGLNSPNKYHWESHHLSLFGSAGYGFAAHHWRYSGGVANQFGAGNRLLELGLEGHSLTDTPDQWIVDDSENNLASLLLRDDYRDYFGRQGFSLWSGLYLRSRRTDAQLRVAFLNDKYSSLDRNTNWSVFGGDKTFRDNPPIVEGNMRSVLMSVDVHHAQQRRHLLSGWSAVASAEIAGKAFHGDFDFNRYIVDVRRYQPISSYDNINLRVRLASATGDVPFQKAFELGGISTMPAFAFKEFMGNRMLLANAEYVVDGDLFDVSGFPASLLHSVNVILFYDAGYTNAVSGDDGFLAGFSPNASTIKSDWGFGIGTRDAKVRIGCAWRTDVSESAKIFLRVERPF